MKHLLCVKPWLTMDTQPCQLGVVASFMSQRESETKRKAALFRNHTAQSPSHPKSQSSRLAGVLSDPRCPHLTVSVSPLLALHFAFQSLTTLSLHPHPHPLSAAYWERKQPVPAPPPFRGTRTCPGRSEALLVETTECLVACCQCRKELVGKVKKV